MPVTPSQATPPSWRDPWAWATTAAVLLLLARALRPPLGEPFADDFNFMRHAFFEGTAWFDGGGARIYWRPLSRQGYFGLMGSWMVQAPWVTSCLHAALLALSSVLIYRAFRQRWPGPWAAAAASFPVLAESSRTFVLWPTTIQDLGALFFSALAIHEASRRRLATAIGAVSAGLLCKETALLTALLLPWLPTAIDRKARRSWAAALGATVVLWGVAYAVVFSQGRIVFQSHFEDRPAPWTTTVPWAFELGMRDALGFGALPEWGTLVAAVVLVLVLGLAVLKVLLDPKARVRLATSIPWIVWGLAWFIANTALLTQVFPLWGPFRSIFGSLGLGIALVALTWAAAPMAMAALVALRLVVLAASPLPSSTISQAPRESAAALDFTSLARLSRFTHETRVALLSSHPTLPAGATVAWHHRPLMAQHAFAGGEALHAWYRDTTLRWISWEEAQRDSGRRPDVLLEFEPQSSQVVALDTAAVAEYLTAEADLAAQAFHRSLARLDHADSLQTDRRARVFLAAISGRRALCRLSLGDLPAARTEAEKSLAAWRDGNDSRYVLAVIAIVEGKLTEAHAQLDSLLARYPSLASGRAMLDTVLARERAR